MIREIRDQWLARLRDGRLQGQRLLDYDDKHGKRRQCCLGVLCELAAEAGIVTVHTGPGTDYGSNALVHSYWSGDGGRDTFYLPAAVAEWAGLDGVQGWIPGRSRSLAQMNDEGQTFAEIADAIEAGL